ncbi:hypothetical protein P775_02030 [Puniceibacterium antarcticum]|uniref:HPt domain-containing protein n=1 Tax=Puniceibacterium antarcticum TaxID=1206336 RepID=A0A2G8RJU8_9RHOB|nr:Hpt domain-containing protein [Puniceibacterium antarcticum]PIL21772.1 hypothetical protein P775_02030 [Puniceibacterium antarcticum]
MIDWTRIRELRDEIGQDDFQEIVDLFLFEVEDTIAELDAVSGNACLLEQKLHFLKGSALNLGFEALSRHCRAGERAAAKGNPEDVDFAQLKDIFMRSRAAFFREVKTQLAA